MPTLLYQPDCATSHFDDRVKNTPCASEQRQSSPAVLEHPPPRWWPARHRRPTLSPLLDHSAGRPRALTAQISWPRAKAGTQPAIMNDTSVTSLINSERLGPRDEIRPGVLG
jgi:hypothetical protein